jgi:hypothetical protein
MPAHPNLHYIGALLLATLALTLGPALHVGGVGADEVTHGALDLVRQGDSLVSGHRSQFSAILRTSSFAELLERLHGNETEGLSAAEDSEDVVRRLMLFRVVAGRRGLR